MKVKIGNYPSRMTAQFHTRYMDKKYGFVDWPKEQTRFENSLEWLEDRVQNVYNIFNWIWFDRRTTKVKVKIDPWDTWSMDTTLSYIILPMLKQLKETKHGAPYVDPKDVPVELQGKKLTKKQKANGDVDDKHFERWDWVLDQMIYSFECKYNDMDPWEGGEISKEEIQKNWDRISNGFRLFGKYYESLWD